MKPTIQILMTQQYVVAASIARSKSFSSNRIAIEDVEVPVSIGPNTEWQNLIQAVIDALEQLGSPSTAVSLIIPSSWCYLCRLGKPAKRLDPMAMSYEMEETLPVQLESVTSAFAVREEGVVGIAVETEVLGKLLTALENRGLGVANVCVDVLVASAIATAQGVSGASVLDAGRTSSIEFDHETEHCIHVRNRIGSNGVAGPVSESIADRKPLRDDSVQFDLRTRPSPECDAAADTDDENIGARALVAANLDQMDVPNLRIGPLAQQERYADMYRRVSQLAVLGIVLCSILWARGYRQQESLQRQFDDLRREQAEVYRGVFPEGTVPRNPATRLASERKRIEVLATTDSAGPAPTAANQPLDDLGAFVRALPDDVRILANEVLVDARQFSLRGHTASHRDAERIADAIGAVNGLNVGSPRTSRLKSGGVEFSLKGRRDRANP
ncbi:MAG TPA: hypothetical protein PKN33_03125 [Phycisphaerae bacterium]|nr:hypothetical protein [Phycisphaerae bacterium]